MKEKGKFSNFSNCWSGRRNWLTRHSFLHLFSSSIKRKRWKVLMITTVDYNLHPFLHLSLSLSQLYNTSRFEDRRRRRNQEQITPPENYLSLTSWKVFKGREDDFSLRFEFLIKLCFHSKEKIYLHLIFRLLLLRKREGMEWNRRWEGRKGKSWKKKGK